MRNFFILLLAFAISFSFDCRDLMASKTVCHLIKTQDTNTKPKCHQEKESSKKDCDCAKTKTTSLQDSTKDLKKSFRIEFDFNSPLNVLCPLDISSNAFFSFVPKILSPHPKPSLLKTIHLLI